MEIPVILFVYNRTDMLRRTLSTLKANKVPKLIVYSDGPKQKQDVQAVQRVRECLSQIDWCEVIRRDRVANMGLGKSILAGVTESLKEVEAALVWEDDLVCVPGTYEYLCAALKAYRDDPRVMSVTGWTNQYVKPNNVVSAPYFDGRAECWTWGTWRRAWQGMMDETAMEKVQRIRARGDNPARYGGDLPAMAKREVASNIWAVRFLYHHILNKGLCLRPPWSMVEHIGVDARATNVRCKKAWFLNGELSPCPAIPQIWPDAVENLECAARWQKICPRPWSDRFPRTVTFIKDVQKILSRKTR